MPTYGYECLSCDNKFEVIQSIKDDPLTTCESCGGTLRKRIYPVGIAFKGSGFYVNDYAPKSEAKAEAKPETKSEAKPDGGRRLRGQDRKQAGRAQGGGQKRGQARAEPKTPTAGSLPPASQPSSSPSLTWSSISPSRTCAWPACGLCLPASERHVGTYS